MATTVDEQSPRMIGQVKWFNNKAGYGFITVNKGEYEGKDIFIHYSTIHVDDSQYKYLVAGEYVEFALSKSSTGAHEYQASEISGINGGKLMCETRRANYSAQAGDDAAAKVPVRRYRVRSDAPRDRDQDRPRRKTAVRSST